MIGTGYWSPGITVTYLPAPQPGWGAEVKYAHDGLCNDAGEGETW